MKLYVTVWDEHPDDETVPYRRRWTGTQADTKTAAKEAKAAGFTPHFSGEVEVPVDKAGLLKFLNEYTLPTPGGSDGSE